MTATRLERPKRQALGSASPGADMKASYVAPALVTIAVTAVLLLSGCAVNPVQEMQPGGVALNLGDATSWLVQVKAAGSTSHAGR